MFYDNGARSTVLIYEIVGTVLTVEERRADAIANRAQLPTVRVRLESQKLGSIN